MRRRSVFFNTVIAVLMLMLCGCSVSGNVTSEESLPPAGEVREELKVYFFNAGKADASLVYNSKFAVLIDCGEKGFGKVIADKLDDLGIKKLDMLIITHFDKDHVGGAAKVLKSVTVDRVIQSNCPKDSEEYREYTDVLSEKGITPLTLRERMFVQFDSADITVDPPKRESYPKDASNNSSLITVVRCGKCSMLFAGDAQDDRMYEFMQSAKGGYDLLKVPYHGHWQKRLGEFMRFASPKIAVITSSDEMPEDQQTVSELKNLGAEVLLTRSAPVEITCDGSSVKTGTKT